MMKFSARATTSFEQLQERSERIVAAGQLLILACIALLLATTPASMITDAPVHAVPLGISIFGILVLVRLWAAVTHQLTRPMLVASSITEMATLIFTIWADHLQFETHATIALKNPNFVFIFVLIALRALRFDPLLVVTSGATAALGWSMVIWHSLQMQGANYITWDYLTYVYTDRIFPIGELSKIFAIIVLTGIMAYVVNRARKHLRDAVGNALAASDLSLFFDASVADKIRSLEEIPGTGRGELRDAAIMFIDLRGFTRASQKLSADALIQMLGDYQQRMVTIISAHEGSIDKFMGDGILVSFGATRTQPDYAARALACMESILADTHVWRASSAVAAEYALDIGLGIASGPVVFGMIGHATRLEFTVLGEPVNLAAKLEKHNKTLGVNAVVLLETYLLAQSQGYTPQSEITTHTASAVAGSATPIDVVRIG